MCVGCDACDRGLHLPSLDDVHTGDAWAALRASQSKASVQTWLAGKPSLHYRARLWDGNGGSPCTGVTWTEDRYDRCAYCGGQVPNERVTTHDNIRSAQEPCQCWDIQLTRVVDRLRGVPHDLVGRVCGVVRPNNTHLMTDVSELSRQFCKPLRVPCSREGVCADGGIQDNMERSVACGGGGDGGGSRREARRYA